MNTRKKCLCLAFIVTMTASPLLFAQTSFASVLNGDQLVPPVVTSATGTASFVLNAGENALTYTIRLVGLDLDGAQTPGDTSDDVTGMHFHSAAAGANGSVVFGLIGPGHDADDLVVNAAAGTVSGVWQETDANGNSALSTELANLLADGLYLNVHTSMFASGEIRGQVLQTSLSVGLQLHLEFENDVTDSSSNGFDGQAAGNLGFTQGIFGQAADFDGTDDEVIFPTFPDNLITDNDFSVTFWVRPVSASFALSVLSKREVCNVGPAFNIRSNLNNTLFFELIDQSGNTGAATGALSAGWHHAAFTRSGITARAFLDGRLVSENNTVPVALTVQNTALLGMGITPCIGVDGTQRLLGTIDDLRVYDRALTPAEVHVMVTLFDDSFE